MAVRLTFKFYVAEACAVYCLSRLFDFSVSFSNRVFELRDFVQVAVLRDLGRLLTRLFSFTEPFGGLKILGDL